mgnify:CR=1 FL=1
MSRYQNRAMQTRNLTAWAKGMWYVALAAGALYISSEASHYLWSQPTDYAFAAQQNVYVKRAIVMKTHIGFGILALLSGTLQFLPALKRHRRIHRGAGVVYVSAVTLSGICGLYASSFAYGGASNTAAFGMMSAVWLITTTIAVISILRRRISTHQRWMKRSFAITLAAVTLRIELGLLIFVGGMSFDDVYLIVPWTSWVLNLLVVEWVPFVTRWSMPGEHRDSTYATNQD